MSVEAKRVSLACLPCRTRRHRCSGSKPCTQCVKMHREAECLFLPSKRGQKRKADQFYEELQSLELPPPIALDAMGAPMDEPAAETPFLGPSAALSFLDLVRAAILSFNPLPRTVASSPGPSTAPPIELQAAITVEEMRTLPPRAEADRLLASFIDVGQGTYPILHEATFLRNYERLWVEPAAAPFYALCNIAWAIGSIFENADSGDSSCAEAYAAKCQRIMAAHSPLHHGSLVTVQVLVFISLYAQSKASPTECWNSLGLATRMALALGLHVEAPPGVFGAFMAEQRRRAWWACYCFDTIMSCMFGRPAMASAANPTAAAPAPYDDEERGQLPRSALFAATRGLYLLLSEIQADVHGATPDATQLKAMLDLETALEAWREALPAKLCFDAAAEPTDPPWMSRHRNILQSRYLHTRILLFRPSLSRALSPTPATSSLQLSDAAWGSAASLCLEAAQRQIQVCHEAPARQLAGSSRWYETAYLFGACAVLLAARWRGLGLDAFETSWTLATDILHRSRPAAARTLNGLRDRLLDGGLLRIVPPPVGPPDPVGPSTIGGDTLLADPMTAPNPSLAAELDALLGEDWSWPSETFAPTLAGPLQPFW